MDDKPLVSVISGYYNRENLVDESIQSLIDQSYQNLEIIIFDDCSTDNTYEKLKQFDTDERVTIIRHEHNIGFVRGLIRTIKKSKGEYIAIHGSGDYSYPKRIEKQVNVLIKNKEISVAGCENETEANGRIISTTKRYPAGRFYSDLQNKATKISGGDVIFKRSYYEEVGGYREFFRFSQDFDLWCRMSLVSEYYIIPEILYRRKRLIKGSVSGTPIKRIKQIFYNGMAAECVKMRKVEGYDYVDLLGEEGFAMLGNTKRVSRKLSIQAIRLYLNGQEEDFKIITKIIKKQKITMESLFVILVYHKIIPNFLYKRKNLIIFKNIYKKLIA